MKHYIVTYEGRLWLSYAKNPKEAIFNVITDFKVDGDWHEFKASFNVIAEGVDGDWHDFTARSVGSYTAESKTIEFKVVDADE